MERKSLESKELRSRLPLLGSVVLGCPGGVLGWSLGWSTETLVSPTIAVQWRVAVETSVPWTLRSSTSPRSSQSPRGSVFVIAGVCKGPTARDDGENGRASPQYAWSMVRSTREEVHWYEAHGIGRKEFKLKFPLFD